MSKNLGRFNWDAILTNTDPGIRGVALLIFRYLQPSDIHSLKYVSNQFRDFIGAELPRIIEHL